MNDDLLAVQVQPLGLFNLEQQGSKKITLGITNSVLARVNLFDYKSVIDKWKTNWKALN